MKVWKEMLNLWIAVFTSPIITFPAMTFSFIDAMGNFAMGYWVEGLFFTLLFVLVLWFSVIPSLRLALNRKRETIRISRCEYERLKRIEESTQK